MTAQKNTIIDITGDSQVNRAICGDFKPENFPAAQSIYAGFVERNIPAIPQPLGSRGSKGLLHEKKCLCKRGSSLGLSVVSIRETTADLFLSIC